MRGVGAERAIPSTHVGVCDSQQIVALGRGAFACVGSCLAARGGSYLCSAPVLHQSDKRGELKLRVGKGNRLASLAQPSHKAEQRRTHRRRHAKSSEGACLW